jgi:DNA-binding response OmpR family regulator
VRGVEVCPVNALARIAVVEDNDDLRMSLVELLAETGDVVFGYACAEDVDESPETDSADLMLVDLNLPGEDGLSLVARLTRARPNLRVIMMTSRTALRDRVRGYDAGADLYLPKPVDASELLAAVRAMTRRLRAEAQGSVGANPDALHLDMRVLQVRGARGVTEVSATEASLLAALARAPAQRLEHWQLMEILGLELDAESGRANLSVRITRLRGKLAAVGCPGEGLRAVRGSGYRLCVPLQLD